MQAIKICKLGFQENPTLFSLVKAKSLHSREQCPKSKQQARLSQTLLILLLFGSSWLIQKYAETGKLSASIRCLILQDLINNYKLLFKTPKVEITSLFMLFPLFSEAPIGVIIAKIITYGKLPSFHTQVSCVTFGRFCFFSFTDQKITHEITSIDYFILVFIIDPDAIAIKQKPQSHFLKISFSPHCKIT